MKDLFQALEAALLRRSPAIGPLLEPALTEKQVRSQLKRAGIDGAVDPIIALYTWHNGMRVAGSSVQAGMDAAIVPPRTLPLSQSEVEFLAAVGAKGRQDWVETYHFINLKSAILQAKSFRSQAVREPEVAHLMSGFFPFLHESYRSARFAVDISPSNGNRVVWMRAASSRAPRATFEAYESFEEFLKDAIRSNETNEPLQCLVTERKPIVAPAAPIVAVSSETTGKIPETENPLVLRTDFSDDAAWESLRAVLNDPEDEFAPELDFISNPAFTDLTAERMPSMLNEDSWHDFAFIVDAVAMTQAERPVLVVDLRRKPPRTFRVIASALPVVASNLSTANMDFDEFLKAADTHGVFRGVRGSP